MRLSEYIYSFSREDRKAVRKKIADLIGVAESTVRSWESGQRIPRYSRFDSIVSATGGVVKKQSLLNEFYENDDS